jgi:D-alanyl-D-alanine carboxypeptidase
MTPKEYGVPASALPEVLMKSGVLVTEDGRVLWSRNSDDQRAMASLTKIMTAVVAMESAELDEEVEITGATRQVAYASGLYPLGAKLPLSELLGAMLVSSSNDAAVAIAVHVAGSEKEFTRLMNAKAEELGLGGTRFSNAHGLDAKGHYSTAADLAVLARYAMSKPEFRRIVALDKTRVPRGSGTVTVENTNPLIGRYEGANGVKTGMTDDAGYSLAASAKREGTQLYAIVLGTGSDSQRFRDAQELFDWGFAHFREQRLVTAGTVVGEAVVTDYLDVTVPAAVSSETTLAVFDLAGPLERSVSVSTVRAPVEKGQRIGVATFTQRGQVVATVPLVAVHAVEAPGVFERIGIAVVRAWRKFTGAGNQASHPNRERAVSC